MKAWEAVAVFLALAASAEAANVACCLGLTCVDMNSQSQCTSAGGTPLGGTCQYDNCASSAIGACCFGNGTCGVYSASSFCFAAGGVAYDQYQKCDGINCGFATSTSTAAAGTTTAASATTSFATSTSAYAASTTSAATTAATTTRSASTSGATTSAAATSSLSTATAAGSAATTTYAAITTTGAVTSTTAAASTTVASTTSASASTTASTTAAAATTSAVSASTSAAAAAASVNALSTSATSSTSIESTTVAASTTTAATSGAAETTTGASLTTTAAAVSTSLATSTGTLASSTTAAATTSTAATTTGAASTSAASTTGATTTAAVTTNTATATAAGSAATTTYAAVTTAAATTTETLATTTGAAAATTSAAATTASTTTAAGASTASAATTTGAALTSTAASLSTSVGASTSSVSTTAAASEISAATAVSSTAAAASTTVAASTTTVGTTTSAAATTAGAAATTSLAASTTGAASVTAAASTTSTASTSNEATATAAGSAATTTYAAITTSASASTTTAASAATYAATTSAAASVTGATTVSAETTSAAAATTSGSDLTTTAAALTTTGLTSTYAAAASVSTTAAVITSSAAAVSSSVTQATITEATASFSATTTSAAAAASTTSASTAFAASTTTATAAGTSATSTLATTTSTNAATTTGAATTASTASATTSLATTTLSTATTSAAALTSTVAAATTTGQFPEPTFSPTTSPGGSTSPPCDPPDFLGSPVPVGTGTTKSQNRVQLYQVWTDAVGGGTLFSLSVYVGPVDAFPNNAYQLALYSTDPYTLGPGALVATTGVGFLQQLAFNTLALTSPVTIYAATSYWIAYNTNSTDDNLNNYLINPLVNTYSAYVDYAFGTWPEPFPEDNATYSTAGAFSMYGTLIGCRSPCVTTGPLGRTAPGPLFETCTDDLAFGSIYTASSLGGTVGSMSVYVVNATTDRFQLGIFTTSNGGSTNFVGNTVIGSLDGIDGWHTLPMNPPVYLKPDTQYFLTVDFENTGCYNDVITYTSAAFGDGSHSPEVRFGAYVYTVPDQFINLNNKQYSIYASYLDSCSCQSPPDAGTNPTTIGQYTEDSCASYFILGSRIQATGTGRVAFARMFIGNAPGYLTTVYPSGAFRMAIYDSADQPAGTTVGALLSTNIDTIVGLQPYRWNGAAFSPPVFVVAGNWYWLMLASAAYSCTQINAPFFISTPGVFNSVEWPYPGDPGANYSAFQNPFPSAPNATYDQRAYAAYFVYASNCSTAPLVACCLGQRCSELTEAECIQTDGVPGPVGTPCPSYSCLSQAGHACCFPDNSCGVYPDERRCLAYGGLSFNSPTVSCSDTVCPLPVQACCSGYSCSNITVENCAARGGVSAPPNVTCDLFNCSTMANASCCVSDGTCAVYADAATCSAHHGTVFSNSTSCAQVSCPQPTLPPPVLAACCFGDSCYNLTTSDCAVIGGVSSTGGQPCGAYNCSAQALGACCLSVSECATYSNNVTCMGVGGQSYHPGYACASISCLHTPPPITTAPPTSPPVGCRTDSDCSIVDSDPCEAHLCNTTSHTCYEQRVPGCCTSDADCPVSPDPCTPNRCNVSVITCYSVQEPNCCQYDSDCTAVPDSCYLGSCGHSTMRCTYYKPIALCCEGALDCSPRSCASVSCVASICTYVENRALIDVCGVCLGDNTTCLGCDGVPNSGLKYDVCGTCGGDGSGCTLMGRELFSLFWLIFFFCASIFALWHLLPCLVSGRNSAASRRRPL